MLFQIAARAVGLILFGFFGLRTFQLIRGFPEEGGAKLQVDIAIAIAFGAVAIFGLVLAARGAGRNR